MMRILSFYILTMFCVVSQAKVFLPGMQPQEAGIEFAKVQQCMMCHANTKNGDADPVFSWRGGMMAQAARDPVFRAALTISNQDIEGVGEFCLRCHTPRGWLENRSEPADGSALNKEDMYGVSCDICHRFIDPVSEEARKLVKHVPPGYGNAMMVADISNTVRGPYGDGLGAMPHKVMKSPFHASGQLCGTCHDISNPLYAEDVN
ncbi:MAG: multiheme c-type cytochrome, partial [Planctomycetota bacterium]